MSVLFWVVLAVALAVVEMLSATFFPIFFSLSALMALGAYVAGGEDWVQWAVFGVGGLVCSGALRPIAKRQLANGPTLVSTVDSMQGRKAVVRDAIDGRAGTGTVVVQGDVWSAKPAGDAFATIPAGTDVEIHEVRGATLMVAPLNAAGVR
jgi:membrane protein implicated in regulation of membrane protease activity